MGRDASLFQKEAFFMMVPLRKGRQRKPHPNHGSLVQRGNTDQAAPLVQRGEVEGGIVLPVSESLYRNPTFLSPPSLRDTSPYHTGRHKGGYTPL